MAAAFAAWWILAGCDERRARPGPAPSAATTAAPEPTGGIAFQAPVSRSGRLRLAGGALRFVPCAEGGVGGVVGDFPDGSGKALVRELGVGEQGVAVMIRLEGNRLQEIRYAGPEGPGCDRLPPHGDLVARGNEPFWAAEVNGSEAVVRTPGEPGGATYRAGRWFRMGQDRWRYEARREADRTERLTLELVEARCVDTMSGARHPFQALLIRGAARMAGCALEGRAAQR